MRTIAIVAAALVLTITTVDAERSRKTFPRTHPDPAFLCTETDKSTLHPDKYFIFKNVYEGIDLANNTVRDVPKATEGDDLIMSKENTAEHSIDERFNKKQPYHKHTAVRKIPWQPNPRFPAEPPYTRIIEGPCEALPDGDDLLWPASVMQYEVCVAAGIAPAAVELGKEALPTLSR
jgi:hypothetical protein